MNDLISRQAAIEEIRTYIVKPNISDDESEIKGFNDGLELAISVLSVLPSVQPERKPGKWIVDALADNIYRCSECGIDAPVEPTGGTEYKSNYCPNCGAYMRERRETE